MKVSDFRDSLGVVTHIGSDPYGDAKQIDRLLDWIGISNIRQSAPGNEESLLDLRTLGQLGARIDLLINGNGPVSLEGTLQDIAAVKPYLNAIEAPNEVNIWPITYSGLSGIKAAVAFQMDLYASVRSDASLNDVPVYSFTLGGILPSDVPDLGDLSDISDYANIHTYAANGIQPSWVIPASVEGMATIASNDPVVITETGYYTLPGNKDWGGVSDTVQAKYLLTTAFEDAQNGISRTYFYDLIDDASDPQGTDREAHFGFFTHDGKAKPAATAFHNLSVILSDTENSTASHGTVGYSVQDLPWTGGSMTLQADNGKIFIALWNDVALWDASSGKEIAAASQKVTVTLEQAASVIRVYDPMTGANALQDLRDQSTLSLELVDHPILVEVTPMSISSEAVESRSAPERTLTLALSEDEWNGDAQFIVSVNGQQIGGAQTVTAKHGKDAPQEFQFNGNWGDETLNVCVQFLNDAWGGSADTDRNLYVDSIALDGQAYAATTQALLNQTPANFTVGEAQLALPRGAGTLNLLVSGDTWKEAPQVALTVDGVRYGGVYTITAQHDQGETQLISVQGSWGSGAHEIGMQLLNDEWGGTSDTDRNAYLIGASYGQSIVEEASASLLDSNRFSFMVEV